MNLKRLPLYFEAAPLRNDLGLIAESEWVTHYKADDYEGDWCGVALRALGGQASNLRALPGAQMLYDDTPLLARCPAYREVLTAFECPLGAVRLLSLAPGSIIREHSDDGLSPAAGEVRLHIPVQTDADVEFYLCGERVAMQPGECWFLNLSLPHRVENHSTQDRVHLILDCVLNEWLTKMLHEDT